MVKTYVEKSSRAACSRAYLQGLGNQIMLSHSIGITPAIIVAAILFAGPLAMAQQTATTPLTQEEQSRQNNLQNTITSLTQYLERGEQEVGGLVFTPRWSNPVWVEPEGIQLVFAYCLPGEFAVSEQKILGGSELSVLESYALALPNDFMVWAMVVENNHEDDRLVAAAGVICAGDEGVDPTAVISPEIKLQIDNILKQFITIENRQITNIQNVINIISNITNQTGPVTPPTDNETDGVIPPTDNETDGVTPPEEDGVTPPTDNETDGVTPPEEDGVTPPEEDGVTPPEEDGVTPPEEDGVTPPTDNETDGVTPPGG
jgi:hypothetical protein